MGSFENFCRLCSLSLNGTGVDLFNQENNYSEQIKSYFKLQLIHVKCTPMKICTNCVFELENICSFKERCIKTQKSFEVICKKSLYTVIIENTSSEQNSIGSVITNDIGPNSVQPKSAEQGGITVVNNQPMTVVDSNHKQVSDDNPRNSVQMTDNPYQLVQNQSATGQPSSCFPVVNCNIQPQGFNYFLNNQTSDTLDKLDSVYKENTSEVIIGDRCSLDTVKKYQEENQINFIPHNRPKSCSAGEVSLNVNLVKKLKTEELDLREEMAARANSVTEKSCIQDELIVGSQVDEELIKAITNNEKSVDKIYDKRLAVVLERCNKVENKLPFANQATLNEQSRHVTVNAYNIPSGVHNKDSSNTLIKQPQTVVSFPVQNVNGKSVVANSTSNRFDNTFSKTNSCTYPNCTECPPHHPVYPMRPEFSNSSPCTIPNWNRFQIGMVECPPRQPGYNMFPTRQTVPDYSVLNRAPTTANVAQQQNMFQSKVGYQRANVTQHKNPQVVISPVHENNKSIDLDYTPSDIFMCCICDKVFRYRNALQIHMKTHNI